MPLRRRPALRARSPRAPQAPTGGRRETYGPASREDSTRTGEQCRLARVAIGTARISSVGTARVRPQDPVVGATAKDAARTRERFARLHVACLGADWSSRLDNQQTVLPLLELSERHGWIRFLHRRVRDRDDLLTDLGKLSSQAQYERCKFYFLASHDAMRTFVRRLTWAGRWAPVASRDRAVVRGTPFSVRRRATR